jgi:hypothetical protein
MPKAISIGIASDTRDFATGIQRGVIEPSQDALDALEAVGDGSQHAGQQLDASMRTAQRGTAELHSDLQSLGQQVRESSSNSRQLGTKFKQSTDEASEGVETLKENTASNLKEVAASFDGTAQGMVGGVQGLVAEVLEGFGPGGLIAGAVLAGGIGLIMSSIEGADEQTQQWKEDVAGLAQSWIDAGRNGRVTTTQIIDGLKGMATQTDSSKASLADVEQQAKTLGVPFRELARVYAEGGDATQYAIDKTNGLIEAEKQRLVNSQAEAGQTSTVLSLNSARLGQLESQRDKLVGVQKETKAAAKEEQEWIEAGGPALEAKAAATQAYADSVQGALTDAGGDWEEYQTKQGVNLEKYNQHIEDSITATKNYQTNVKAASLTLTQDALNYIESLGEDAAPLLQEYIDAPNKLKGRTAANWDALGKASSATYNSALQAGIPDSVQGTVVKVTADLSLLHAALNTIDRTPIRRSVVIDGVTKYGQPII